jgi:glyoxylase-like metal-dependent hydrolase (beta-lactamase superfamily II)
VFTAPEKPYVAPPPAVGDARAWDPTTSTLIFGARDAVLVDPQMTVPEAAALADWVELHDRNLTTIYITHGHGDHYLGLPVALDRFPDARAAAMTRTVAHMQQPGVPAQACNLGRRSAAGFASPPGLARHHRSQANEIVPAWLRTPHGIGPSIRR